MRIMLSQSQEMYIISDLCKVEHFNLLWNFNFSNDIQTKLLQNKIISCFHIINCFINKAKQSMPKFKKKRFITLGSGYKAQVCWFLIGTYLYIECPCCYEIESIFGIIAFPVMVTITVQFTALLN